MWHNVDMPVERDVRLTSSSKPLGATFEAIEPVSRLAAFDFSKDARMTGTTPTDKTPATLVAATAAPVKPQTIREFERALKSLGYSQRESTAIAKSGFKAIGIDEPEPDLSALKAALAKNTLLFESTNHEWKYL